MTFGGPIVGFDDPPVGLGWIVPAAVMDEYGRHQHVTDDGPKLPKPWLVRRMLELQIAKTPRAARSLVAPVQSS